MADAMAESAASDAELIAVKRRYWRDGYPTMSHEQALRAHAAERALGDRLPEKDDRSVGAVVIGHDAAGEPHVLLIRMKGSSKDSWSLPKGHPEAGESDEVAIAREVLEETGVAGVRGWLRPKCNALARYTYCHTDRRKPGASIYYKTVHFVLAIVPADQSLPTPTRRSSDGEVVDCAWMNLSDAQPLLDVGIRSIMLHLAQQVERVLAEEARDSM